ncbi:hypothetical protein [Streptosporangium sp. CA-115845]|uniref:hypothetical protein n=1 Tax=Streptosporangium sp. CA-115845 TaxID=3240071 RepID=UPI003D919562
MLALVFPSVTRTQLMTGDAPQQETYKSNTNVRKSITSALDNIDHKPIEAF